MNLNGRQLKIAVNKNLPYIDYNDQDETIKLTIGYEVEILRLLGRKFNFTYSLIECNRSWGSLLPDRSWTGIIGQLDRKTADLGLAGISINQERFEVVNFAYPHTISAITYITSRPRPLSKFYSMINIFDMSVWISLIFSLITMVILITYLAKLLKVPKLDLVWINLQLFVGQSVNLKVKMHKLAGLKYSITFNMFLTFWLIFCFEISTIYGNFIYAQMVLPPKLDTIDTIEMLSEVKSTGGITMAFFVDTSAYNLIKESKFPAYRKLSEYPELFNDEVKGIDAVVHSDKPKAFIASREKLNYLLTKYEPDSYYLPPYLDETSFFLNFLSIAFNKDFEFVKEFSISILCMKEAGLFEFWENSLKVEREKGKRPDKHSDANLKAYRIYFYLFTFGTILSCSIFAIENCLRIKFRRNSKSEKYRQIHPELVKDSARQLFKN